MDSNGNFCLKSSCLRARFEIGGLRVVEARM